MRKDTHNMLRTFEQKKRKLASSYPSFVFCEIKSFFLRCKILKYYKNTDREDIKAIIQTIKNRRRLNVFPYEFVNNYAKMKIEVYKDPSCGLLYVMDMGKKLYLKRKYFTPKLAKRYYRNLCIEQDLASPHCYITNEFYPDKVSVIFDIGSAEGMFALRSIDSSSKTYCFECDPDWVEALKMTFAPYMDKIEIVQNFVTDHSSEKCISINDFIDGFESSVSCFIKMDIEGSEVAALSCSDMLPGKFDELKMAVCTYHFAEDEINVREACKSFNIETSDGYMIYYYDFHLE